LIIKLFNVGLHIVVTFAKLLKLNPKHKL